MNKEYAQTELDLTLIKNPSIYNNTDNILYLAPHQKLLSYYMDPRKNNSRMLAVWPTGSGKTIGALAVAKVFIEHSLKKNESVVKILGFTEDIFKNELLKYPEFNYVSFDELDFIKRNRDNSDLVSKMKNIMKRRLTNTEAGGFFEFHGYRSLFQHLFIETETSGVPTIKNLGELYSLINSNKIRVVKRVLESFNNAFVICDEIHNVYNNKDNNSWGIAINYIIENTNAKFLFISATPISNSQEEIISVINLLSSERKYSYKDFFDDSTGELTNSGRDIILKESEGKVSYLKNTNASDFPRWNFNGSVVDSIFGLKFVKVPISKEYESIYSSLGSVVLEDTLDEDEDEYIERSTNNKGFINDFYLKAHDGSLINTIPELLKYERSKTYSTEKKNGFSYNTSRNLSIDENFDDEKYAPKYNRMIRDILDSQKMKSIIYHNNVKNNGIFFISQLLDKYGFIKYGSSPIDTTLCFHCGRQKKFHSSKKNNIDVTGMLQHEIHKIVKLKEAVYINSKETLNEKELGIQLVNKDPRTKHFVYLVDSEEICEFTPCTYSMIWSSPSVDVNKILEKFNDPSNARGDKMMIILGSKKIKEALDFKSVRKIYITSRPPSISTLIQIIGRGIRNKSHDQLPKKDRTVDISIYVNWSDNILLDEIATYKYKMDNFLKFRKLENLLYINSINAFTYPKNSDELEYKQILDNYVLTKKEYTETIDTTFDLLYTQEEVANIKQIIKQLFIQENIWEYKDLVESILKWSDTNYWNTNTNMFSKENIDAAIVDLCFNKNDSYISVNNERTNTTNLSIVSSGKTIFINGEDYEILPFKHKNTQYFKLQQSEQILLTEASSLFDKASNITIKYNKFTVPISRKSLFEPEEFILRVNQRDLINEIDLLLQEDQTSLILYLTEQNIFGKSFSNMNNIKKATIIIFYLIFTGLLVVNLDTGAKKSFSSGIWNTLTNITNNIFKIGSSMNTMNKLPSHFREVLEEVIAYSSKNRGFGSLFIPVRIQKKKALIYNNTKNEFESVASHTDTIPKKENSIVVGFTELDPKTNKKIFKLREPIHVSKKKDDSRTVRKGSYYMNIPIKKLIDYVKALEPDITEEELAKFDRKEKIGSYLKYLLRRLDKNSIDGTRYYYW